MSEESLPATEPRKRRRYLQFSVRTMLAIVTLVAVWLGFYCQAVKRQKESAEAVQRLGGWVYYDYQMPGGKFNAQAKSSIPRWLVDRLGQDFFHRVVEVNLVYNDHGPSRLDNQLMSDEALPYVTGFPKLRALLLKGSQATDAGLKQVGQLKHLEKLYMWDASAISDAGIAHLAGLQRLRIIHCNGAKITDESLRVLAALPHLEEMSLQQNGFTDAGLAYLKEMKRIRKLGVGLRAEGITDAGLAHLKGLSTLEVLDLQHSHVTAEGLEQLRDLKNLKQLWLSGSDVTDTSSLQQALPNCQIDR